MPAARGRIPGVRAYGSATLVRSTAPPGRHQKTLISFAEGPYPGIDVREIAAVSPYGASGRLAARAVSSGTSRSA